jgi:co-chaperonin GroES (HSP10)
MELEGQIAAANITSTGTVTLNGGTMRAGTDLPADGTITLKDVKVVTTASKTVIGNPPDITVKRAADTKNRQGVITKVGNARFAVNGKISGAGVPEAEGSEPLSICVMENDNSAPTPLNEGLLLATAKLVSDNWFRAYNAEAGTGSYKSGNGIYYGSNAGDEVKLITLTDDGSAIDTVTDLKTYEEAVNEINSLSQYKAGTKQFREYEIVLLKDVEITNAKNNAYVALPLPQKTSEVKLSSVSGNKIFFNSAVTLKSSLILSDRVTLIPVKPVKTDKTTTVQTPYEANYALGGFRLTMQETDGEGGTAGEYTADDTVYTNGTIGEDGKTYNTIAGISGGSKSILRIEGTDGAGGNTVKATGAVSIYELDLDTETGETAKLETAKTVTLSLIGRTADGSAEIARPSNMTLKINGAAINRVNKTVVYIGNDAEHESAGKTVLCLTDKARPVIGSVIAVGKTLNSSDYKVRGTDTDLYRTYMHGQNLRAGAGAS